MADQYYRFFPGDYARATADLSLVEHGAYRLLLDSYYATGQLSTDPAKLARICRATTPEERLAVETVARRFFTPDGDTLRNRKADHEIEGRKHFLEEQARKSKLGVAARVKNPGDNPGVDPKVNPPSPSPSLRKDNNGITASAADAVAFSSSTDQGNCNGKANPAGKGRRYIDENEIISVQRRLLDYWEENFGRISTKVRYAAAKHITDRVRELDDDWMEEDDFIAIVDWYAEQKPALPMSPAKFFGTRFREMVMLSGVEVGA
jgi:uncharacterized protein YdaU (DUF1376 family)